MKNQEANAKQGRQPYEKPCLSSFPLAAGDVLAKGGRAAAATPPYRGRAPLPGGKITPGS